MEPHVESARRYPWDVRRFVWSQSVPRDEHEDLPILLGHRRERFCEVEAVVVQHRHGGQLATDPSDEALVPARAPSFRGDDLARYA